MTKQMLVLRTTPNGHQYYEVNHSVAGSLPSTKNHQGRIQDDEDESNVKMFELPGSPRCPVQTVISYLLHLHPDADFYQTLMQTSTKSLERLMQESSGWFPYDRRRSQTIVDRRSKIANNRRRSQKKLFPYNHNDRRAEP